MSLALTNLSMSKLTDFLVGKGIKPVVKRIAIYPSPEEDKRNEKNGRCFCHVNNEDWGIYCAAALDDVHESVRWGILLHEIGHLYIPAMDTIDSEVDVDVWIVESFPELGYKYLPVYSYSGGVGFKGYSSLRVAKNIQSINPEFLRHGP